MGQRVLKATPEPAATVFHYASTGQLLATSDGAGANSVEYVWLGALPLAQIDAGTIYTTHADHLGAPKALTDGTGAIVWDATLAPFGEVLGENGISVVSNLRFPGQYFDEETGTYYNYFRDYDPAIGRYLQSDPIGLSGGLNTYAYVGGNPVTAVDPDGLNPRWFNQAARALKRIPGLKKPILQAEKFFKEKVGPRIRNFVEPLNNAVRRAPKFFSRLKCHSADAVDFAGGFAQGFQDGWDNNLGGEIPRTMAGKTGYAAGFSLAQSIPH